MKIKVISSHNMDGLGAVAEGTVLDVPEQIAKHKIAMGYAVAVEDPPAESAPAKTKTTKASDESKSSKEGD